MSDDGSACPSASDEGVYACSLRAGHDGDHDYVCRETQPGVSLLAELFNREIDAAIAYSDAKEREIDEHGYGKPGVSIVSIVGLVAPDDES